MTASPIARDERTEAWLASRGVQFSPPRRIPLGQIKHKESRGNQARAEGLIPEVVDRYVVAVKAGEQFPPIVVYKAGNGYMVVDGNHRDEAHAKANEPSIAAYELDPATPSDVIELLTVEANVRHGQPTDTAWRVRQAIHLLDTGQAMDVVVTATGVTKSQIEVARRVAKADLRAARLGVYGWGTLASTTRQLVGAITSDPVFTAVAEVVIDTGMTMDETRGFVREIKAQASEADALRITGEEADQRKSRKGTVAKNARNKLANPRLRVTSALGAMMAIQPGSLPRVFTTEAERKEIARRCGDAALVLMEMEEVLRDALGS